MATGSFPALPVKEDTIMSVTGVGAAAGVAQPVPGPTLLPDAPATPAVASKEAAH
ncbi:MAG TPA: hypothetical protein VJR91_25385 [Burkholderia sp.]|nr:hypothetical protein [Burkholderia sp.]